MNKILKKLGILLIAFFLIFTSTSLGATSKDSAELQNKINEKKAELSDVNDNKSEAEKQVESLQTKITEYQNSISDLEEQISDLNNSIKENEENLKKQQEEYDKRSDLLDQRLVTMYQEGSMSYLDMLLSSKGLTEFLSNYYLISEVATVDNNLLNEMEKQKKSIEDTKTKLENDKKEIESSKQKKVVASNNLSSAKTEKEKYVGQLTGEAKQLQDDIAQYEKDKKQIDSEIAAALAKYNKPASNSNTHSGNSSSSGGNGGSSSSGGSSSNSSGNTTSGNGKYMRPVNASITCGWLGYAGHTGIDFGAGYGTTVRAAEEGTVIISKAVSGSIKTYYANGEYAGSYSSYGEYIAILHPDGNVTAYAHGKPKSRLVEAGQHVSRGQAIMSVGNTGNVRPRPSESNPTAGTHLHFEVRLNGTSTVNPLKWL